MDSVGNSKVIARMHSKGPSRREFLRFLGSGSAALAALPGLAAACKSLSGTFSGPPAGDQVSLAAGFRYQILISQNTPINKKETFGHDNDYIDYVNIPGSEDLLLWVNHEGVRPFELHGTYKILEKRRDQVDLEREQVGGSLIRIRKTEDGWQFVPDDPLNRRLTSWTPIPFVWPEAIHGSRTAIGTLANCAGGKTPWGTILTCEENYDYFVGERHFNKAGKPLLRTRPGRYGWELYYDLPPEHYGWVVEVEPMTGKAKKLVSLGRFAHESATTVELLDGRCVVYSGDDIEGGCIYKFIAAKPGDLSEGRLYVADTENGKWILLDWQKHSALKEKYKNQTEVLTYAAQAAKIAGGTALDRPEDIAVDPVNGQVLVTLTNNIPQKNYYGSFLKITEENPAALEFRTETFMNGGPSAGFACPDNMEFDSAGNLWFTSDVSGGRLGRGPYKGFNRNGLFFVPRSGEKAGEVLQVAAAPVEAEFSGPKLSPDGNYLFLSVQHPGETGWRGKVTSHWPDGGENLPKSAVIVISAVKGRLFPQFPLKKGQ